MLCRALEKQPSGQRHPKDDSISRRPFPAGVSNADKEQRRFQTRRAESRDHSESGGTEFGGTESHDGEHRDSEQRDSEHRDGESSDGESSDGEYRDTVQIVVPQNAVVMLCSLDETARTHIISIAATSLGSVGSGKNPCVETTNRLQPQASSISVDMTDLSTARDWCPLSASRAGRLQSTSPRGFSVRLQAGSNVNESAETAEGKSANPQSSPQHLKPAKRVFRAPYFEDAVVSDRIILAEELATDRHMHVFGEQAELQATAERIVFRLEQHLLAFCEQHLGTVTDADGDCRLTIVLTELGGQSRLPNPVPLPDEFSGGEPIRGCVRAADFHFQTESGGESGMGGDIIYLSTDLANLADDRELDAVLVHELAHAAVFSRLSESAAAEDFLPGWLNEAVAHYMERQICSDSTNLRRRLRLFRSSPGRFPVVVPDTTASLSLRRGPARAAGCLFVETVLSELPADAVRQLVLTNGGGIERLEAISGKSFRSLMQDWGLRLLRAGNMSSGWTVPDDSRVQTNDGTLPAVPTACADTTSRYDEPSLKTHRGLSFQPANSAGVRKPEAHATGFSHQPLGHAVTDCVQVTLTGTS
ncbi:MAG: hypothetical protein KDA89_20245, partial [Planctomycetaceae bacterium]|nr:hypothetical protein [Planctomycetaceae bacterium]